MVEGAVVVGDVDGDAVDVAAVVVTDDVAGEGSVVAVEPGSVDGDDGPAVEGGSVSPGRFGSVARSGRSGSAGRVLVPLRGPVLDGSVL